MYEYTDLKSARHENIYIDLTLKPFLLTRHPRSECSNYNI